MNADEVIPPTSGAWLASHLSAAELAAVTTQGFVSAEQRSGAWVYKLRFRVNGRQRTCYIGRDMQLVEAVKRELDEWQAAFRRNQALKKLVRRAKALMRQQKRRLAPFAAASGWHCHGRTLRKARRRPGSQTTT